MKQQIKKWALGNSNALLITGTGRNGTTYVARALKAMNPNLTVGHEIEPNGLGVQNLSHADQENRFIQGRGTIAIKSLMRGERKHALIESNCYLAPTIPAYSKVWNQCKVIGIIRDWKSCITSMASQSFPGQPHFFYDERDPQANRRPDPIILGLQKADLWEKYDRIEKIAWYWSYVNDKLLEAAEASPRSTMLLDFKELKSNPQQFLDSIQEFNGLPSRSIRTDQIKKSTSQEMNQVRISLDDLAPHLYESVQKITSNTALKIQQHFTKVGQKETTQAPKGFID